MKAKGKQQRFDITDLLISTQSELTQEFDGLFAKEDALELLHTLETYLQKNLTDAMGDPHFRLFEILRKSCPDYVRDHNDGKGNAIALLHSFSDVNAVKKALKEYAKYVDSLPDKAQIEQRFTDKLFELYKNYKSSSDYMSRLTDRLLAEELRRDEPTQVRILRQFIYRFGCMKNTPCECAAIAKIAKERFGGDFAQMAVSADTALLNSLFADGKSEYWKVSVCVIVEQRGCMVQATAAVKELVRRVFSPLVLKEGDAFENAERLADCFVTCVTQNVLAAVVGSEDDAELLKITIKCELEKNPPEIEQYPLDVRLSAIARSYADSLMLTRDNPLLTHLPEVYLRKKTPPSQISFPFNAIIDAKKLKTVNSDFETCAQTEHGVRLLEADICRKDREAYVSVLKDTADERLKNRAKTVKKRTFVTSKMADIAKVLADGFFDSQKKTREYLYLYAVAFNMTFPYAPDVAVDKQTDIAINLFEDYYTDNLINYIGGKKSDSAEKCVDGYSINYKNCFEVIFLYYIARRMFESADSLAAERQCTSHLQLIQNAYAMIDRCAERSREELSDEQIENDLQSGYNAMFTAQYKKDFLTVLRNAVEGDSEKEKEFEDFIVARYDCKKKGAVTANRSENRTAFSCCSQLYVYLNDFIFETAGGVGAADEKNESRAVATLRRKITDKSRAKKLVEENVRLRQNCTDCPQYAAYKRQLFVPQNKCKQYGKQECMQAGKTFEKDACAQCSIYKNMNIHRFVPSFDCPYADGCTFEAADAAKTKRKDVDYYNMIRHVMVREFEAMTTAYNKSVCSKWLHNGRYDEPFCKLLEQIELRLRTFTRFRSNFRMQDTSRTALLTLYYMYLVLKSPEHKQCKVSFADYFDCFCNGFTVPVYFSDDEDQPCKGINQCLVNAGYQKINAKNVFDIFVCFLAYRETYDPQYTFSQLCCELLKTF
ncbi:MAG: hypothetical protein IJC45_02370 [Clostridia bacterium]|nr:hypothetical protein [Clostridia bacterium]